MLWQCYDYGLVRLLDKKHHNRFRKDHLLDFSHTKLLWHLVTNIWFLAAYTSGKNQDISHRQIWFDSIWFSNVETTVVFVLAAIWNSWQLVHIYIYSLQKSDIIHMKPYDFVYFLFTEIYNASIFFLATGLWFQCPTMLTPCCMFCSQPPNFKIADMLKTGIMCTNVDMQYVTDPAYCQISCITKVIALIRRLLTNLFIFRFDKWQKPLL